MKHLLIILDGASDEPCDLLGGATPLEAASTPNLDRLAAIGVTARLKTSSPGLPVDTLSCIPPLLGLPPALCPAHGRASFEALAQGITLGDADIALRCNLVHLSNTGLLADPTAGAMSDDEARRRFAAMHLPPKLSEKLIPPSLPAQPAQNPQPDDVYAAESVLAWELHPGQGYRGTLILRNGASRLPSPTLLRCPPPHMHLDEKADALMPKGRSEAAAQVARALRAFMRKNTAPLPGGGRIMPWVWSPSTRPRLPAMADLHGFTPALISGTDLVKGLGAALGMYVPEVPGATGDADTNYSAKAHAALNALERHDVALVHVNAPDEAAHQRLPLAKKNALERADALLIGPVLQKLEQGHAGAFTFSACADHMTRSRDGAHAASPVPWLFYNAAATRQKKNLDADATRWSERAAAAHPALPADAWIELVRATLGSSSAC